MTTVVRIPAGRFCRWLCRRTNPWHLITRWPFRLLVRLRFFKDGGCAVLIDREAPR